MIIVWAVSWWYGAGWKAQIIKLRERLAASYDYFSVGLLLKTVFSPYKQISAGQVSGSIEAKWRAFVDRLISRIIGAFVRLTIVVIGSVWLAVQAILGGVAIILWAFVPIAPLIGFVLMVSGWVPVWL